MSGFRRTVPSRYARYVFGELLIGGRLRASAASTTLNDVDPFTGNTLVQIPQTDVADIDAAFETASRAQRDWAATMVPTASAQTRCDNAAKVPGCGVHSIASVANFVSIDTDMPVRRRVLNVHSGKSTGDSERPPAVRA